MDQDCCEETAALEVPVPRTDACDIDQFPQVMDYLIDDDGNAVLTGAGEKIKR